VKQTMKMSQVIFIAMVSSILVSVVIPSYHLSQLDPILSVTNAFAQGQGEMAPSSNGTLQLAYTKLGVMSGSYQQIRYDSGTNSLGITNMSAKSTAETEPGKTKISSSQDSSQSQSNKRLTETDLTNLRQTITNSGLFEAVNIYPPDPAGTQDYTLNVLSVTMDNKPRTIIWTSASENVPAGLTSVANTIDDIASR
jgi:hypothetical protein